MNQSNNLNRRDFLRLTGSGAAAVLTEAVPAFAEAGRRVPATASRTFVPDVEIALKATPAEVSLLPGQATRVWESVRHGYVDEGWKDTVLLMPGERVKALLKFEHYPGLFLYHCHILEHEDNGLMRNYLVRA